MRCLLPRQNITSNLTTGHFERERESHDLLPVKEIDISVGAESQVAVATTLTSTTAEARSRFSPLERGCYFEGELQGRTAVQQDEGQKMLAADYRSKTLLVVKSAASLGLILFDLLHSSSICRGSFTGEKCGVEEM